ncbi:UNVERIFIED_CONTAM: hypothetical protein RF648_17260 [Kocuria sp. CPCC 205274]
MHCPLGRRSGRPTPSTSRCSGSTPTTLPPAARTTASVCTPLCLLAEASATELDEVRSVLRSAAPGAGTGGLAVAG